jgi:hypothetical protein
MAELNMFWGGNNIFPELRGVYFAIMVQGLQEWRIVNRIKRNKGYCFPDVSFGFGRYGIIEAAIFAISMD